MAQFTRLAMLLLDAADKRGGQSSLARDLGMRTSEISALIHDRRYVTRRQAMAIEDLLGASARELLIEAAIAKISPERVELPGYSSTDDRRRGAGVRLRKTARPHSIAFAFR
jgi:DNA-binding transcriptional regulator YdaS (Cro superfamily)